MRCGPILLRKGLVGLAQLLAGTAAALAQIGSAGPEIQVASTATFQAAPAVAWQPAGQFVVAWQKQSAANGGWDVFARQYGKDGTPVGAEFQVNTTSGAGCRQAPAIAADARGNFLVSWQSDQGGSLGIFGQLFNAAGQRIGSTEFAVNTTTGANRQAPAVAMAPDGRFMITWQSDGQDGSSWSVFARAYQAGGAPASGEFQVNTTTAGAQHSPAVAYIAAAVAPSRFEIVWQSEGQDAGSAGAAGIFGRSFDGSGTPQSGEQAISQPATGAHGHPRIAADPSGNFVVTWENVTAGGSAVLFRRFISTGLPLSSQLPVDASAIGAIGAQRNPSATADAVGDFVVVWDSLGQDGSGTAVLAQQFDHLEVARGGKLQLNVTTAGDQAAASAAMAAGGSLLIAWQSQTPAGDASVVTARTASLPPLRFYTLTPCRMVDTRNPNGPLGGPILTSGQPRNFPLLTSACAAGGAIPATAKSLSLNVTAVGPSATGSLVIYPGDAAAAPTNTISLNAGAIRANNSVMALSLNGDGSLTVLPALVPNATVHFVIDVNGYFQ
jgi:hypothetical protein